MVDADGALLLLSDARKAYRSGSVVRGRFWPGDFLWHVLKVCPSAYQFDSVTQEAISVANLREGGGYDVRELPAYLVELVMVASGTMAEYSVERAENQRRAIETKAKKGK